MKKLLIIFGILLCMCSCTYDVTVYECTISYTIEGKQITETHTVDMPSIYVPSYRFGLGSLEIIGSGYSTSRPYTTIYQGSLNVKVTDFDYKTIRTYTASKWDGHEIKIK